MSATSDAFEWAGVFKVPESNYMWTSQKVKGKYADALASMKFVAMPLASATESALDAAEKDGIAALGSACTDVQHAEVITPTNGKCFKLVFHQDLWQSVYKIDASGTSAVALFTEHVPTEFEATAHYLKDKSGEDIEPVAELPKKAAEEPKKDEKKESKPYADVIGASIIVNHVTLIGVILIIPVVMKFAADHLEAFQGILNGFAAGAILAAAFFLLMFEATHLIATGWKEEVDQLWRWGTCILAGFVLPSVIDCIAGALMPKEEASETEGGEETKKPSQVNRIRILAGVLIGDFFHNLCDGFFIGAAFSGCGTKFGWTVTLSTVLHELPQELADYFILTSPGAALSSCTALVLNFVSGMSVVLGAIVVLASDPADSSVGILLAFGAGTYLHIGAVECMPKIYEAKLSAALRVACIVAFIVGTIIIGLILLDHEHCVPAADAASAEASGHAGHNHSRVPQGMGCGRFAAFIVLHQLGCMKRGVFITSGCRNF